MSENDVLGDSTNPDPASAPVRLHRSSTNRKVAGVAGGIGERFDIDANVVRVVFIVLTLAAGLGAAIYLAMWACVPQSGAQEGDEVANTSDGGHHWRFRSLVLLAGALCLGPVSYTHLDVYKRQSRHRWIGAPTSFFCEICSSSCVGFYWRVTLR